MKSVRRLGSIEAIDDRIAELEQDREQRSMSLPAEKRVLAEIRNLEEQKSHKVKMDNLYAALKATNESLTALNGTIRELSAGVRKCDLAAQISQATGTTVAASDIVDETTDFSRNHFARLVGKGGSNLKAMQTSCGVLVDIDRKNERVKLTGTPDGIARAMLKLEEIAGEEEKVITISEALRKSLIHRSFAGLHRVEETCGVRVQLPRDSPNTAVLRGGARGVAAGVAELKRLEAGKATLRVPARLIPALIGKSGANFRRIQSETGVDIQVVDHAPAAKSKKAAVVGRGKSADSAPAQPESVLTLRGTVEAVAAAKAQLEELVDVNTERSTTVDIPADMISWLVANGGKRIQAFQRQYNVYAQVRRPVVVAAVVGDETKDDAEAPAPVSPAVVLRGINEKLGPAVEAMRELIGTFGEQNVYIDLNSAQARALIGTRGAGVQKLRADTGATIDVAVGGQSRRGAFGMASASSLEAGQARVRVSGTTPEQIEAAVAAVRSIVDRFVSDSVDVSDNVIVALLRSSGAGVSKLSEGIQVNIDIVKGKPIGGAQTGRGRRQPRRGPGCIKLSGDADAVATARERLDAVIAANFEVPVEIEEDEFIGALVGKGGASIKALQTELEVRLDIDRAAKRIVCRGDREKAQAAAENVAERQRKYIAENATLKVPGDMIPMVNGRGGALLRTIESDTGATLASGREGVVRIHCETPEGLVAAVAALKEATGMDKEVGEVTFDPKYIGSVIGRGGSTLNKIQEEFSVVIAIVRPRKTVVIRGDGEGVARAKARIRTLLREAIRVEAKVVVPTEATGRLFGHQGANIRALREQTKARIDVPPRGQHGSRGVVVTISGTPDAVEKAKAVVQAIANGQETYLMELTPEHVKAIDERTRTCKSRLQEALNAQFTLHVETGTVRINGTADSVTSAARSLEQLLQLAYGDRYQVVDVPAGLLSTLAGDQPPPARKRRGDSKKLSKAAKAAAAARAKREAAAKKAEADDDASSLEEGEVAVGETNGAGAGAGAGAAPQPEPERIPTLKEMLDGVDGVSGMVNKAAGRVSLWGEPANMPSVKEAIANAVSTFEERHASVRVKEWMVRSIVGTRGATIQKLEKDTGASLRIADRRATTAVVEISGESKAVVQSAKSAVEAFIESLGVQESLSISSNGVGAIIGTGGATIRKLQEDTGVAIDVSRSAGTVTLRGKADKVAAARARIEELLEASGANVAEASVSISCHRGDIGAVVGKGGAVVRAIQTETGARVDINKVPSPRRTHMHAHAHARTHLQRIISCRASPIFGGAFRGLVTFMPLQHCTRVASAALPFGKLAVTPDRLRRDSSQVFQFLGTHVLAPWSVVSLRSDIPHSRTHSHFTPFHHVVVSCSLFSPLLVVMLVSGRPDDPRLWHGSRCRRSGGTRSCDCIGELCT